MTSQELLNKFIVDSYSQSGKIKRSTAVALMQYVNERPALQRMVNAGDNKGIREYSGEDRSESAPETFKKVYGEGNE